MKTISKFEVIFWAAAAIIAVSVGFWSGHVAAAPVGLQAVDPVILGTCSAAVHDRYVVTGPDGQLYRTWHPTVVTDGAGGMCRFAHDHGDNPASSLANNKMPAFEYVGTVAGFAEPHEGFKVFVINQGARNDEGGVASNSTRLVAHMGTGGAGRFDTRYHSAQFDLVAPGGYYVHVAGMFDTGGVGSICANPRQGKTVVTVPSTGCSISSLYEIWSMTFSVGYLNNPRVTVIAAPAVFDPITILNPNDPPSHRATYYAANYFPNGPFYGCDREEYSGPVYWYNQGRPAFYMTDVYGNINQAGPLVQNISPQSALGIRMSSSNFSQMKFRKNQCVAGLGLKN